jgi:hypothetical protein
MGSRCTEDATYIEARPREGSRDITKLIMPSLAYLDNEYQSTHYNLFKESITVPLKPALPPGVTQHAFDNAVQKYKDAVGEDQVLLSQDLTEYIDPYELQEAEGTRKMPSAAVRPGNIDELKEVLKISNEFGIPVWTFSRGKNLG